MQRTFPPALVSPRVVSPQAATERFLQAPGAGASTGTEAGACGPALKRPDVRRLRHSRSLLLACGFEEQADAYVLTVPELFAHGSGDSAAGAAEQPDWREALLAGVQAVEAVVQFALCQTCCRGLLQVGVAATAFEARRSLPMLTTQAHWASHSQNLTHSVTPGQGGRAGEQSARAAGWRLAVRRFR